MKTMTSALAAALAAATLLSACTDSADQMHVKQLQPNRWTVSMPGLNADDAEPMSIYRAALVAKAAGYPYFQVVDFRGGVLGLGQSAGVQFVGVRDAGERHACLAKKDYEYQCVTRPTDEAIAKFGAILGRTPQQIEADVRFHQLAPEPAK